MEYERPTDSKQEEQEISPEEESLRKRFKKIPHPGTVRVTIFPNPRGRRFEIEEND